MSFHWDSGAISPPFQRRASFTMERCGSHIDVHCVAITPVWTSMAVV
jgi:hypothetical protein